MIRNIYYSFVITCFLFSRHFLTIGQPHNAFYYGQTLKDFLLVCLLFILTSLILSIAFLAVRRLSPKHHKKIVFTVLYISILPFLDYVFITVFPNYSVNSGFARMIYPFATLAYIPVIIFFAFRYRIEKHGEKIIVPFSFICILIVYYAIPNSFSRNVIENKFVYQDIAPVHMIVFDGTSYEVLNDKSMKHLFPNINKLFADNCYVFEEAYSLDFFQSLVGPE